MKNMNADTLSIEIKKPKEGVIEISFICLETIVANGELGKISGTAWTITTHFNNDEVPIKAVEKTVKEYLVNKLNFSNEDVDIIFNTIEKLYLEMCTLHISELTSYVHNLLRNNIDNLCPAFDNPKQTYDNLVDEFLSKTITKEDFITKAENFFNNIQLDYYVHVSDTKGIMIYANKEVVDVLNFNSKRLKDYEESKCKFKAKEKTFDLNTLTQTNLELCGDYVLGEVADACEEKKFKKIELKVYSNATVVISVTTEKE